MFSREARFSEVGYAVVEGALGPLEIDEVSRALQELAPGKERTRKLLSQPWCADLARKIERDVRIRPLLPQDAVAVQCTYFPKTPDENWKVGLHRDQFIPVRHRLDRPGWSGWSVKEGMTFVQPPAEVLRSLVAVRVHLEENTEENGPLVVVPGSHTRAVSDGQRVTCCVPAGGALILRPMLLHASSKVEHGVRRVLHFLFGPPTLPDEQDWAMAV